jgi:hypothetical protein
VVHHQTISVSATMVASGAAHHEGTWGMAPNSKEIAIEYCVA